MAEKKRYGTYGYSPDGKRVDMYVENGQTYLSDGTRLPSGYSVQTKAGIYKMGDNGGYSVNEHNAPQYNPSDLNSYMNNFKFQSDKDYSQLGKDSYKSIYDAKSNAIRNRLNLDTQALDAQTSQINTGYDNQVQAQYDMNKVSKDNYSNETLNRGLGRSTIASTGLASMDMANQKQINSINNNRNIMLNNIQSRIQALIENANSEIGILDSNRGLEEQKLAMELEDRDRNHWLQESQLNAPLYQNALKRQWNIEDKEYDKNMKQYDYDMGLEREGRQYREGTPEYNLMQNKGAKELETMRNKIMTEFDVMMENELQKYTPGTNAYKVAKGKLEEDKARLKMQLELEKKYRSSSGSGYSGYSKYNKGGNGSNNYKGQEYQYYNNLKDAINYIDKNTGDTWNDYNNSLIELKNVQREMANDLQFQNTVSNGMKNEIYKLLNMKIKYYEAKVKHGASYEPFSPRKPQTPQDMLKTINPYASYKASTKNSKSSGKFKMLAP